MERFAAVPVGWRHRGHSDARHPVLTNRNVYWDHWDEIESGAYGPEIQGLQEIEAELFRRGEQP